MPDQPELVSRTSYTVSSCLSQNLLGDCHHFSDGGKTFGVVHSVIGGCPLSKQVTFTVGWLIDWTSCARLDLSRLISGILLLAGTFERSSREERATLVVLVQPVRTARAENESARTYCSLIIATTRLGVTGSEGNREMYQNCAAVDIRSPSTAPLKVPRIFEANIFGAGQCNTIEVSGYLSTRSCPRLQCAIW